MIGFLRRNGAEEALEMGRASTLLLSRSAREFRTMGA
jgi:hypothetical protein